jgi:hypothetical protein
MSSTPNKVVIHMPSGDLTFDLSNYNLINLRIQYPEGNWNYPKVFHYGFVSKKATKIIQLVRDHYPSHKFSIYIGRDLEFEVADLDLTTIDDPVAVHSFCTFRNLTTNQDELSDLSSENPDDLESLLESYELSSCHIYMTFIDAIKTLYRQLADGETYEHDDYDPEEDELTLEDMDINVFTPSEVKLS